MLKNHKKGNRYSLEFKDSIIKRLTQPSNETVVSISEETGIPKGTIYKWVQDNKKKQGASKGT